MLRVFSQYWGWNPENYINYIVYFLSFFVIKAVVVETLHLLMYDVAKEERIERGEKENFFQFFPEGTAMTEGEPERCTVGNFED